MGGTAPRVKVAESRRERQNPGLLGGGFCFFLLFLQEPLS